MTEGNQQKQFDSDSFLRHLTHQPGVYRMYDESGDVIYVGKAKDLRKRVSSYFREKVDRMKTQVLVKQIASMDVTVTNTEAEALILENSFIKKYRPRYNVLLRDDKSYPYIILTSHQHPKLGFHRGARRAKGDYFGPFPNGSAVRESLNLLQKLFPIRQCDDSYYRARTRPCLQYQLKRCLAPCVNVCTDDEYNEQVALAKQFLQGKNQQVIDELMNKMEQASTDLDFERAARFRDQIAALRKTQERNSVTGSQQELDVIGLARGNGMTTVQMLFIRDNHLQGSRSYFPKVPTDTPDDEVLRAFLLQFYLSDTAGRKIPREVVLPVDVQPDNVLAEVMSDALSQPVKLQSSVRGDKRQYQSLAQKNAVNALESRLNQQSTMNRRTQALQQVLEFGVPIQRMECFDISHTMGQQTVASCVVFDQNGPKKSDYRRYNITGITPGDDYAAMSKALAKRYDNAKEQGNIPDILFIDGGKGQLAQAENYFNDWGKEAPVLIGVAKGESRKPGLETLIMAGSHETIPLSKDASALHLIQHIRDESHRFAITGHRQKRAKVKKTSTLEQIDGVGAKRRQAILKNLGGLQEVKNASIDKLASVPGISRSLAEKIYYSFRDE
ncbi:excinuclease ABC subunit UvrC [Idiomarina loihiensis]|jgi:excinuclease ABC subunit C|uniref:UvrABC system protein C n=1 Tax=Idiomarina loihiensis (strain ATCC BAA-735 / DSM 15497 / L2-TR) TaxID=283942 RepID=UVRC_IDILO|nr:excinuclease ABC subunit UvrC [Idiomarina loihiensis]Q5R0A6.1 RecName: Full=UvrABC system protein C; Short=Protein UvrC; AltName: Full=Excinuclease ABC subunit C [Idiomarina loihiensis L2TR]AAV81494.1 Nuclease subunit of the excinuclease complex, UvrC [Idiomarina loihiensis L2TR]AGM35521.1 excinuclease ABC subunit C [Idiomarina loihiensis GSL 199]